MEKIRKDDEVIVLTGKDKGKRGDSVSETKRNYESYMAHLNFK